MKLEKVTKRSDRWYDDACGTALALELVGERWALLIVRELLFGPRRFGELKRDLSGISANVLTQRLTGLEQAGILTRRTLAPPASVQVYELTEWGYQSERAIQELGRWAARSPAHDTTLPLSAASLMMSFRTMFVAARAGGPSIRIGFRLGTDRYLCAVGRGELTIARGESGTVDATLTATPPAVAAWVYGGRPLADAERDGSVVVEGGRAVVERFATLFVLPPKADAG